MEAETDGIVGHIQTDAFCEGCGYNLHTQAVTRDERLGILVCRCPECGQFAAAGRLTSARNTWLNRLGLGLLIVWILFLIWVMGMLAMFQGIAVNAHVSNAIQFQSINPTTMPTTPVSSNYYYHYELRDPPVDTDDARRRWMEVVFTLGMAALLGCVTGGVVSVCMWHARRWQKLIAFFPTFVGAGIVLLGWIYEPSTVNVRGVIHRRVGVVSVGEVVGVMLGLWVGRPVARFLLSILIPPKPRQHLAFLWTTDGKQLKL